MRTLSSVVSITGHVALGAVMLFGTAKSGRSDPARPIERTMFFQPPAPMTGGDAGGPSVPGPITVAPLDLGTISVSITLPKTGTPMPTFSPLFSSPHSGSGNDPSSSWGGVGSEAQPEVLSGPIPVYPELLRQAGVQGEVLFEAVVDTTGRVLASSVVVIAATHPGFVAAARQALLATLFRPARVGGRAVQTRVRIPYAFAIRGGTGRAR
jgi:protein TonB